MQQEQRIIHGLLGAAAPAREAVLEIEGLTKKFRNGRGIENITLAVGRGESYGFFGPNGAGKTTVMKIIAGLCRADSGTVRIFGQDPAEEFEKAMQRVGLLIETAEAYEDLSGYSNLLLASRYYPGVGAPRIEEVLEEVGLAKFSREKVRGYSLGMKQRLSIAAALLSSPDLLILDEPTNGLDIEGMAEMRKLLQRLTREKGMSLFISSHIVHEMELLCDRVGILYEGRLIREANMSDIVSGPHGSLEQYFLELAREQRGQAS